MEQPVLSDRTQYPEEKIIYSHIGKSKSLWDAFFAFIHKEHPDISEEWRYYNDGKSWLMKVTRKTKTIFWLSIIPSSFRATFYLTDKASEQIRSSSISETIKEQFGNQSSKKIRGITVVFQNRNDLEDAKTLLAIKKSMK